MCGLLNAGHDVFLKIADVSADSRYTDRQKSVDRQWRQQISVRQQIAD